MSKKQEAQSETKQKHFKEQFEDEDVLLVFRKHPVVMRKGLILAMFGVLLGPLSTLILTYTRPHNPPSMAFFFLSLAAGFLLGALIIMPWWIKWYFSVYIMTNKRFIQQSRSLLQVNVVDISLDQIQMINYRIAGLQETLLSFGTIVIQTYVGDLVIRDIHHPSRIQNRMVHNLRELGIHPTVRPMADSDTKVLES